MLLGGPFVALLNGDADILGRDVHLARLDDRVDVGQGAGDAIENFLSPRRSSSA